jgi:monoamine oxidase
MNHPLRSPLLRWLSRALGSARADAAPGARLLTRGGMDLARRRVLQGSAVLALASNAHAIAAARTGAAPKVAVIAGGLAGLTAAYELSNAGIDADVFEASTRLGGRCYSDRDTFAGGQIVERGGELIDTEHRSIRQLARRLGLALDDVVEAEAPGTVGWILFDGERYSTEMALRDFQPVYPVVMAQSRAIGTPGYRTATAAARELDAMNVAEWIDRHVPGGGASRLGRYVRAALEDNYAIEAENLSALIAVMTLSASTREELDAYGGSDSRFHVREGNDAIATRLAAALRRPVNFDSPLVALARRRDGRCEVTVRRGSGFITDVYDRVILALPFANLRDVDLTRAAFRPRKLRAIRELPMAASAKLQLQFDARVWRAMGNTGSVMVDGIFTTWETTRAQAGTPGILNVWSTGGRAVATGEGSDADQAARALAEIERVLPGISKAWNGRVRRTVWDAASGPRGSYAFHPPGYLTSLGGIEAESEGSVHFAGEHTSREWQGFLNGAVESGQRAAREVLRAARRA